MSKADKEAARQLRDALVEELLSVSDEELLTEFEEDGCNPEAEAASMRTELDRAAARGRMALAKARVVPYPPAMVRGSRAPTSTAKDIRRETLAARNGRAQSERDLSTAEEDVAAIEAFQRAERGEA